MSRHARPMRSATALAPKPPHRPAVLEPLEGRILLSGSPLITEFMADNTHTLADGNGNYSDWIEVYNPTDAAIALGGWYLTDNLNSPAKWAFPARTLQAGERMVVFASAWPDQGYVDPAGNPHATFRLDPDGGDVALVAPDGQTVIQAYHDYPQQLPDISYGITGIQTVGQTLVSAGSAASFHVPTSGEDPLAWTAAGYDDGSWARSITVNAAEVLITEVSTGDKKIVEIQNCSNHTVTTTGWRVLANDATGGINSAQAVAWSLPASIAAGGVLYRTSDPADGANYWGSGLNWDLAGSGWVMIVNPAGTVMDFLGWGYGVSQIAAMDVNFGTFTHLRPTGQWSGDGAPVGAPGNGNQVSTWVAFNDCGSGPGTSANTTLYTTGGPASGLLKDVATGAYTTATVTTTQANCSILTDNAGSPAVGTDAYNVFSGYVDLATGSRNCMQIAGSNSAYYTYTFSGLDTGNDLTYSFTGTAIRGNNGYDNRWTLVTLEGADHFTAAHSSGVGVVTYLTNPNLLPNQVAIWTGVNNQAGQGFVAAWTDIDPGLDGIFSVKSEQYKGITPGVGSGDSSSGEKGYGVSGIRLEAIAHNLPTSWLRRGGNADGNSAADFVRSTYGNAGTQNPTMTVPFGTTTPAKMGIGFSNNQPAFDANIQTNVASVMKNVNASLWARVAFTASTLAGERTLTLRMKYDDGFVAYLNGVEVARRNATGAMAWNSAASGENGNANAVVFEDIDISQYAWLIGAGTNVLSIHGLNRSAGGDDFLMLPELVMSGVSYDHHPKYFLTPTPRVANGTGQGFPGVVINEIHYDPLVKTELVEFVEVYNGGPTALDLGGWTLAGGVDYTFPPGTTIAGNSYLVVTEDPGDYQAKYGRSALGPWIGRLSSDGETVTLQTAGAVVVDQVTYQLGFPWPTVGETSERSIQLIDYSQDNDLGGNWRSASPTPGAANSVVAANSAPFLRQVDVSPKQPLSGQAVTITVKITDLDGLASVVLQYQLVDPGAYIEYSAAAGSAYQMNWTSLTMRDDGTNGDEVAGDDVYTAVLPAAVQTNRRLVRYRVVATDGAATPASVRGPYADDLSYNFAYYVYDGVPSWSGAIQPGVTPNVTYTPDVIQQVAVYQLICTQKAHEESQAIPSSTYGQYWQEEYPWVGTFVYDGEVYDNIHFRARGGCWRYSMGKNMWKFDFNRGHYFQARDDYGNKYATKWDNLNFSACIQQGDYQHRGEQGMFEAAGFELFNLAGVPAPLTNWVSFRIVEQAAESGPTQYDGDFQGLYLTVEQEDGNFLDQHGLPDGNLYKIENSDGVLNNQGPTAVSDKSDINAFKNVLMGATDPTEAWWRANVDLQEYYSYRAVVEIIHHGDIAYGKNYFWYLNPETNLWSMLPWDLDLTWANNMYGDGRDPFLNEGDIFDPLDNPNLLLEYKNRLREIEDLLFNSGVMNQLLDELANIIDPPGPGLSIVDADRAYWDYNPIMTSSYVNSSKAGAGRFYQQATTKDFRGMVQIMKNYVTGYRAFATSTADTAIPNTPTITYVGQAGYPVNKLSFRSSAFSDTTGSFAAMEWRVAEVTDATAPAYDATDPLYQEITNVWESGELTFYNNQITVPPAGLKVGHAYRARVRMKDSTGRWGHWSAPVQFIAAAPAGTALTQSLRVTELMCSPASPPPGGDFDKDEFEFIELRNTGATTLNLAGVTITKGVTFSFAGSGVTSLAAGQYVVIARNPIAFASRYDTAGMLVVGPYDGRLDDKSEKITLTDATDGLIQSFQYDSSWYGQTDAGGFSLAVVDEHAAAEAWDTKANWRSSWARQGTPGRADDTLVAAGEIVISEVLAHSDELTGDWIELHNTTTRTIPVGGWLLSDAGDYLEKYCIAAGTEIGPGGYLVLTQTENFGLGSPDGGRLVGFSMSELGDDLYLCSNDAGLAGGLREHVDFRASPNGGTIGLYAKGDGTTDFTLLASASPGQDNSGPALSDVVFSEVMYAPLGDGLEYIELYNRSSSAVPLYDPLRPGNTWRLSDAVQFTFALGLSIPAHGRVLVVGTDPAAFRAGKGLGADVAIYGPWTGLLDNVGETVRLERPDVPEPDGTVPFVELERLKYGTASPWPVTPATAGASLVRIDPRAYANDVTNWQAGSVGGTPGAANGPAPTVVQFTRNAGANRPDELTEVAVRFSQDVWADLALEDLVVRNDSTGLTANLAGATLTYDALTNTARWDLSVLGLGAGYYTVTVWGQGVLNCEGLPLGGGSGQDYLRALLVAIPGDVDLDGRVDAGDLAAVQQGMGLSNAVWASGDLNHDTEVDWLDYLTLKCHFGQALAGQPSGPLDGAGGVEAMLPTTQELPALPAVPTAPATRAFSTGGAAATMDALAAAVVPSARPSLGAGLIDVLAVKGLTTPL